MGRVGLLQRSDPPRWGESDSCKEATLKDSLLSIYGRFAIPGPFGYDSINCPGGISGPSIAPRFLGLFEGVAKGGREERCLRGQHLQTLRKAGLAEAVGDEG